MAITVDRTFVHKTLGEIGRAVFELKGTISMDGKVLGPNATLNLVTFMTQTLQDTYGKADLTKADAIKLWATKKSKLADDTIGTRTGSDDPMEMYRHAVIRGNISGKPAGVAYKAIKEAAAKAKFLDDYLSKQTDGFKKQVEELAKDAMDEAAARKARYAALGDA